MYRFFIVRCVEFIYFQQTRYELSFLSSTGDASVQLELEDSIRASLERADQEIRTALQKLVDPTTASLAFPQEKKGAGDGLHTLKPGIPGYSPTRTRSPETFRDANTQTPVGSSLDEEASIVGAVPRKKLSTVPFSPVTFRKAEEATEAGIPIRRQPLETADWHHQREESRKMWNVQHEMYIETTEQTCVYQKDDKISRPPCMQLTIEDVHVQLGKSARFEAVIEGNPLPTITWYKNNALLKESDMVRHMKDGARYSLILQNTVQEDGGVYTCVAKNYGGEVSCKAELIVHEEKEELAVKKERHGRKVHSFYDVKEEIGRGSFSFVKRVVHKGNKANCAAKFIPLRSKTRIQAYRERDIVGAISHEKMTLLLDSFETKKTIVLILELCSSEELLDRLFWKGSVTECEVKLYMKQVLEGIEYLHKKNILHLDIKPSNILMVHPDKEDIKICDFGFALKIDPSVPQYSQYGSPEYVSPEIASQMPVSKASDIWAVGVISYLSLTCSSPFAGENDRAILKNVQLGKVFWDSTDFVRLSEAAKDFVKRLLQIAAEFRPNATECLSHEWFLDTSTLEGSVQINTKRLKFLLARSKWQRSLMSYNSVLVMRSISELLYGTPDTPSLGVSRHLVEENSSPSTSGSSSDNECGSSSKDQDTSFFPEHHLPLFVQLPSFQDYCEDESSGKDSERRLLNARQVEISKDTELSHVKNLTEDKFSTDQNLPQEKVFSIEMEMRSELIGSKTEESVKTCQAKPIGFKAATIEVGDLALKRDKSEGLVKGSMADSALLHDVTKEQILDVEPSSMCVPRQSVAGQMLVPKHKHTHFTEQYKPALQVVVAEVDSRLDPQKPPLKEPDSTTHNADGCIHTSVHHQKYPVPDTPDQKQLSVGEGDFKISGLSVKQEKACLSVDSSIGRPASVEIPSEESTIHQCIPVSVFLKEQIDSATHCSDESVTLIDQVEQATPETSHKLEGKIACSIPCDDYAILGVQHQEDTLVLQTSKERPMSTSNFEAEDTALIGTFQKPPEIVNSSEKKLTSAKNDNNKVLTVELQEDTAASDHSSTAVCEEKAIKTVRYQVTLPTSEHPKNRSDSTAQCVDKAIQIVQRNESTAMVDPSKPSSPTQVNEKTVITVQFEDATLLSDHTKERPASTTLSNGENTILIVQHQRTTPVLDDTNQKTTSEAQTDNERTLVIVRHQASTPVPDLANEKQLADAQCDKESTVLVAQHQRKTPVLDYLQTKTSSAVQCGDGGTTVVFKHRMASPVSDSSVLLPVHGAKSGDISFTSSVEHQKNTASSENPCATNTLSVQTSKCTSSYNKEETATLECIVDEMVYLSKEMNVLANSISTDDGPQNNIVSEEIERQQDPRIISAESSRTLAKEMEADCSNASNVVVKIEKSTSMHVKTHPCIPSSQHSMFASFDQLQASPVFHEHIEDVTLESGSSSKTYFSHSCSSGTGRRSDNFSDFEEAGRESEVSLVEISDILDERSQSSSHAAGAVLSSVEPVYVHLSDLYDMRHVGDSGSCKSDQESTGDGSSLSVDELLQLCFEKETPSNITDVFAMYPNIAQDTVVQTSQTFYENIHGNIMERVSRSSTSERGWSSSASTDCSSVDSELLYNDSKKTSKVHRSSSSLKQRKSGLFWPYGKTETLEKSSEQSIKQKVKASMANISRIIKGKPPSERERKDETAENRRGLSAGESFEGTTVPLKKKSGLSSFKLSSFKSKEKVTLPPAFVEELTDQTVIVGHSITLSCRTSAHSHPTVEWFKDGIPIQGNDRVMISSTRKHFQLLTILAVTAQDLGIYACVATNCLGGASTCCLIKKAEILCSPTSPDIAQVHEDGALVIWKPVESIHPVTYTLQCRKEAGEWQTLASDISDCSYLTSNLSQGLVYSFRIACSSKAGMGSYSSPSAEVKIGEKTSAALQAVKLETPDVLEEENRGLTPSLMASGHPTYAFQSEMKRGRFSTVRKCWEKSSGRLLAAKMIPYTPENKQSKVMEYHILKKLHHTNIVQLHAAYISPRHLVLILELCEGLDLLQCLAQGPSYSELEVRDYLWQMLSAVEFLHTSRILHLDIRSENTIVTEHKLLKLLDFGSAQVYTQDQVITTETQKDFIENMAPELLEGHGAIPQTDVWAVGITAFIMLSADYPFCLDVRNELEKSIKQGKIKFTKCYAGLSGGAVSFLQSALWVNAWGRPSASDCLQSPWLQEAGMATTQQVAHVFLTTKLRGFLEDRSRISPSL
ncbi:hypothetical protein NDU88_004395 [Pleurodeles waltl]|uniref:Obscurin n=1 Tax=Pleurodeles waltl TaxID=8319 RepID=A0AAV7M7R5_PLEWA|nr:hypothetical protein NDU88_004395 [Pleurodeles waltl]